MDNNNLDFIEYKLTISKQLKRNVDGKIDMVELELPLRVSATLLNNCYEKDNEFEKETIDMLFDRLKEDISIKWENK